MSSSYKNLIVWKKGIELSVKIYKITEKFPKEELYGISSQLRRASVSIPSNIAEGYGRNGKQEYKHFLGIAKGSSLELETQVIISKELGFINEIEFNDIVILNTEIIKILTKIIQNNNSI